MSRGISVSQRVACWKQSPLEAQINSIERVWLIKSAAVDNVAANEVFNTAHSNGRSEGLNLAESVWVLPEALLTEGSKEVESTLLVKVVLKEEFSWLSNLLVLWHGVSKLLISLLVSLWGSGSIGLAS